MDTLLLSRIQFGVTTLFHILFPALTIGLSLYLVVIEFLWIRTKQELYYRMYRFWVKLFAINFGVGAVTGIVLEFEFGTNFSRFSQAVGNVLSPLLIFEVLTAFFLESGFLGIMLVGWKKVSRNIHFLATCLVATGTILSSFWILAANSWMQTPSGYEIIGGKFMVTDFYLAIFNPSMWTRMTHMTTASIETSVFVVAGVSAYFLLNGRYRPFFQRSLGIALAMAALAAPLQVYIGDLNGRSVTEHQPAKLAAIEAHWNTNIDTGAPFALIALPDAQTEKNIFELSLPHGLSLLATHSLNGRVSGLREFPRENRPNVFVLFWTFRIMTGVGIVYLLVMIWAFFLWKGGNSMITGPFYGPCWLPTPSVFLP